MEDEINVYDKIVNDMQSMDNMCLHCVYLGYLMRNLLDMAAIDKVVDADWFGDFMLKAMAAFNQNDRSKLIGLMTDNESIFRSAIKLTSGFMEQDVAKELMQKYREEHN